MTFDEVVAEIDERISVARARFEQSVVAHLDEIGPDHLNDLLAFNTEWLLTWRADTLHQVRSWLASGD